MTWPELTHIQSKQTVRENDRLRARLAEVEREHQQSMTVLAAEIAANLRERKVDVPDSQLWVRNDDLQKALTAERVASEKARVDLATAIDYVKKTGEIAMAAEADRDAWKSKFEELESTRAHCCVEMEMKLEECTKERDDARAAAERFCDVAREGVSECERYELHAEAARRDLDVERGTSSVVAVLLRRLAARFA